MPKTFYDKQFELGKQALTLWALTARRLRRSADLVFAQHESDLKALFEGTSPLDLDNLELAGCATLLYGLAMENLLKAIFLQVTKKPIINGKFPFPSKDGHDQVLIAKGASLKLSVQEEDMLSRLTAFVRWAGRYPIPRYPESMQLKQIRIRGVSIPMPIASFELSVFNNLYSTLESTIIP